MDPENPPTTSPPAAAIQPGPRANPDVAASAPDWRDSIRRIGLQGKIVLCFTAMLILVLGTTCWLVANQSRKHLSDIMGEQARQISYALALASKPDLEAGRVGDLRRIGKDLLKTRNILFVAFFDCTGRPSAFASRDPDLNPNTLPFGSFRTEGLMQTHAQNSSLLGDYVVVMSPVLSVSADIGRTPATAPQTHIEEGSVLPSSEGATRLVGYVAVGVSQAREAQQLGQINYMIIGLGCVLVIISLPLAYALVHRIFLPIRQLVAATQRLAAGDWAAQVAIHRPDAIGTLARSFNEMVLRVKSQQEAVEEANSQLALANVRLAEANSDLELKIQERTGQLETANRRLSNEIAEKEDFLRVVSHDLNAPLRNIAGMATMLLVKNREKFDQDVVHRLERIQKNVDVETDLIGELLELSRIKTRRQKIETVEIDALVRDLADVFENDLKDRNIELVVDNPLPALECEKARLRQVFQNLIDNAIKYMGDTPDKPREIHVGCNLNPNEAEFYVRDTGMGIEPDDIDKVFSVFRRGKSAAVQNVAGKGVGLSSVKTIVEMYSGCISVQSRVGEGSTFRFTINGKHVSKTVAVPTGPGQEKPVAA